MLVEQGRMNSWRRTNVAPPTEGDSAEVWEYVPDTRLQAIADALDNGTIRDIVRGHLQGTNDGAAYNSGYSSEELDGYADDCVDDIRDALTEEENDG